MKQKQGLFITFEGGEGSGKTVQIKLLSDELWKQGYDVVITREPGGTVISEQIREVVLSTKNIGMAFTTEVLLFQAARAQIYRELIIPSLKAGKTVLCDRSRDSSVVYQGIVRGFGRELIENLNEVSTNDTYPDVTILLDVPASLGLKRRSKTDEIQRMELEQQEFHEKVRQGYLQLAKENDRNRWVTIDGSNSIDTVHRDVISALKKKNILT